MFVQGKIYRRQHLHSAYGGQKQGGISTPTRHNIILLFTGEAGQRYGYVDGLTDEGLFLYTGEGQRGDMAFVRGNRAVRDHTQDRRDIHLFASTRPGYVRYIGQMICTGFHERRGVDADDKDRKVIVFELTPISAFEVAVGEGEASALRQESMTSLREKAVAYTANAKTPTERKTLIWYRSQAIKNYVLRRANGTCEACDARAPFVTPSSQPYLEPHHIRRLSDGGPDSPLWVIALCPNCHRRAHYGIDASEFNERLKRVVAEKEAGNTKQS